METDTLPGGAARSIISLGHLLVGSAALVFAGVLILAGSDPRAELGGVLLPLGLLVALAAAVFTYTAIMVLRRAPEDRHGASLSLSIVELVVGVAMVAGLVVAVQGYGAFEPWRSPLLLPSALLLALGLAGLRLEVLADHQHAPQAH
jgi:drug/metabolite transporter (DMT)-like permease